MAYYTVPYYRSAADGDPTTDANGNRVDQPAFDFNEIAASNIPLAPYNFVDPLQVARQTYKQNVGIYNKSFNTGAGLVNRAIGQEFDILKDYYSKSAPFIQGAIGQENAFNQEQLLKNIETGTPGARQAMLGQISDAQTYAKGNLTSSILDAAFDQNSRSMSADRLRSSGFGQKSMFGEDASNKFSAMQRFGISQYGNDLLSRSVGSAIQSFTSAPTRSRSAETFPTTPSISPAGSILQQTGAIASLGTIQPDTVASMKINQEQFRTNQVQNRYNNLASMGLDVAKFNSTGEYTAQVDNYNAEQNALQQEIAKNQQKDAAAAAASAQDDQNTQQAISAGVAAINSPIGQSIIGGISDFLTGGDTADIISDTGSAPSGGYQDGVDTYGGTAPDAGGPNYGSYVDSSGYNADGTSQAPDYGSGLEYDSDYLNDNSGIIDSPDISGQAFGDLGPEVDYGTSTYRMSAGAANPPSSDGGGPVSPLVKAELSNVGFKPNATGLTKLSAGDVSERSYSYTDLESGEGVSLQGTSPRKAVNAGMRIAEAAEKSPEKFQDVAVADKTATTTLKSLFANPRKLLNIDDYGNPRVGIDPQDMGIRTGELTLDNMTETQLQEVAGSIDNHFQTTKNLGWKEQNAAGVNFINDMYTKLNLADDNADPLLQGEQTKFSETFSNIFQKSERTGGELRQGTDTANWFQNQSKDFGLFADKVIPKDPRAFSEFGVMAGKLVQNWDSLSPKEKLLGTYLTINSSVNAHRGFESPVGNDELKTRIGTQLETDLEAARQAGDSRSVTSISEKIDRLNNPNVADKVFSAENKYHVGTVGAGTDLAAKVSNWDKYNTLGKVTAGAKVIQDVDRLSEGIGAGSIIGDSTSKTLGQGAGVVGGTMGIAATVKNWDEMNAGQKALGAGNSVLTGKSIYNTIQNQLAGEGAKAGATSAASGTGQSAGTSAGGIMAGVGTAVAVGGAIYAGHNIIKNWGERNTAAGAANGMALGASVGSLVPGIGTLAGAAIGAALGAAVGQIKAGKHEDNIIRDSIRKGLTDVGFLEYGGKGDKQNFYLTLANGSKYDISGEHQEGEYLKDANGNVIKDTLKEGRTWYDKSKVQGDPGASDKLRPFNVDYTCDLDYMTSLSGMGLSKLMGLPNDKSQAEHLGGYFTNAATSNAASRDFTPENFTNSMANMRPFYEKAGFTSEDQVNKQAETLFNSGKIDQGAFDQIRQGASMVFTNNYELASNLNKTRWDK
jgi:hypothetical protein